MATTLVGNTLTCDKCGESITVSYSRGIHKAVVRMKAFDKLHPEKGECKPIVINHNIFDKIKAWVGCACT